MIRACRAEGDATRRRSADAWNGEASGDDWVEGNGGGDLIVGGAGADLLLGGGGDDRIGDPGPGASDEIRCGDGEDFVEASPGDRVAADCERVERP